MLIKFKVSNYCSINELQEFNMLKGATRSLEDHVISDGNLHVLKDAVIYGANASGKTSFIEAISVSKRCILSPLTTIPNLRRSYCRSHSDNKLRDSYFEFIFSFDGRYYSYGFETVLSECRITSEWLIELGRDLSERNVLFMRDSSLEEAFSFGKFREDDLERLRIYAADMKAKENTTFLMDMQTKSISPDSGLSVFNTVFRWFTTKLLVNSVKMPNRVSLTATEPILRSMDTDISKITFADVKIEDLHFDKNFLNTIENSLADESRKNANPVYTDPIRWIVFELKDDGLRTYKVCTVHESSRSDFDVPEESKGTVNALFLSPLLTDKEDDITYILDEFGNSLHPMLSRRFIELFHELNSNRCCQLIVATHEMILMTLDLFRRDEIWFVSKNGGDTTLYSLEEFQERFDRNLSKAYMEGRYGALPIFTEVDWGGDR